MIAIKVEGDRVIKYSNSVRHRLPKNINRGGWRFSKLLSRRLSEEAPYGAYGYLKQVLSMPHRIRANEWVIKAPYYLKNLEKGTAPHLIPRMNKIETWARRHGWSFIGLRNHISKYGTKKSKFQSSKIVLNSIRDFKKEMIIQVKKSIRKV